MDERWSTPVPVGDDLVADLHWQVIGGRTECVGVTVRTWNEDGDMREGLEPRPLRTGDLRALPFASIVTTERALQARAGLQHLRRMEGWDGDADDASHDRWEREEATPQPGRPPMYGEDHYREVAEVYLAAWQRGDAPTKAVAEHFPASRSAAAKWVSTARTKYGLLGPATPGRAGAWQAHHDQ